MPPEGRNFNIEATITFTVMGVESSRDAEMIANRAANKIEEAYSDGLLLTDISGFTNKEEV